MDKILVEGGHPLKGQVHISGAKNAALPILVSSLLAEGSNTYSNVPNLKDVESIMMLLSNLGARAEAHGNTVHVDTGRILSYEAPYYLVRKMWPSTLVLGPMVTRLQKAR